MSGLTLGLLQLDAVDLEVLRRSGTDREKRHAAAIEPVRVSRQKNKTARRLAPAPPNRPPGSTQAGIVVVYRGRGTTVRHRAGAQRPFCSLFFLFGWSGDPTRGFSLSPLITPPLPSILHRSSATRTACSSPSSWPTRPPWKRCPSFWID